MVKCYNWSYSGILQILYEYLVVLEPFGVYRLAISTRAQLIEKRYELTPSLRIRSMSLDRRLDIWFVATSPVWLSDKILGNASMGEVVPVRRSFPVQIPTALYLIGR